MTIFPGQNLIATDNPDFSQWLSYPPTWTSSGTAPVLGNGVLLGTYIVAGKICFLRIILRGGSTTTQGTGNQSISIPLAAQTGYEQDLMLKVWNTTNNYVGYFFIDTGASSGSLNAPTGTTSVCSAMTNTTTNVGTGGNCQIQGYYVLP